MNEETAPQKRSNLAQRVISAAILAPVVLGIVWYGSWPFVLLMAVCFALMYREWLTITGTADNAKDWAVLGAFYIGVPCAALALFRVNTHERYDEMVYLTIAVVWATDIGAYFVGRKFGKHKLAPKISPKKTWEGLAGGMLCAALTMYIYVTFKYTPPADDKVQCGMWTLMYLLVPIAAFLAIIAQIGDLFESWIKRKFGVKDSGNLIPGHGGLLDRMDGILSVSWAITIFWAIVN